MDQTLALTLLLLLGFTPAQSHDPLEFHRESPEDFNIKENNYTVSAIIEKANKNLGQQRYFKVRDTNNLGTPYDYGSVVHYGRFFIQERGTIIPIPDPNVPIGRAKEMSNNDILRVNKLYCE